MIGVHQLEISKTKEILKLVRRELFQVKQKKKRLEELSQDIQGYLVDVNRKINYLKQIRLNEEHNQQKINHLLNTTGSLKNELYSIEKERNALIVKERALLDRLNHIFNNKSVNSLINSKEEEKKVKNAEDTLDYVLEESQHLLSEEGHIAKMPLTVLESVSEKRKKAIHKINQQLGSINDTRKQILKNNNLLSSDQKSADLELLKLKRREKQLERKLLFLLKRKEK